MGDIALRGNKLTKGQGGHGPIPYLNKPGQAQGTHGGKAKGGVVRRPRKPSTHGKDVPTMAAEGGRIGLKKGGKSDKNWIQKAVNPKHKGFCTPMTKKTCTPRRKALARTFKKMGRERKAKG